jgi:hypothetical protein
VKSLTKPVAVKSLRKPAAAQEPWKEALRRPAGEAPELERWRDQLSAGLAQRSGNGRPPNSIELDERARIGL